MFVSAESDLAARAEADVAELRGNLRTACLEPFADLAPTKRQALMRRLERLKRQVTIDHDRNACGSGRMLTFTSFILHFLCPQTGSAYSYNLHKSRVRNVIYVRLW